MHRSDGWITVESVIGVVVAVPPGWAIAEENTRTIDMRLEAEEAFQEWLDGWLLTLPGPIRSMAIAGQALDDDTLRKVATGEVPLMGLVYVPMSESLRAVLELHRRRREIPRHAALGTQVGRLFVGQTGLEDDDLFEVEVHRYRTATALTPPQVYQAAHIESESGSRPAKLQRLGPLPAVRSYGSWSDPPTNPRSIPHHSAVETDAWEMVGWSSRAAFDKRKPTLVEIAERFTLPKASQGT